MSYAGAQVILEDVYSGWLLQRAFGRRPLTIVRVRQYDLNPRAYDEPRHKAVAYHRLKRSRHFLAFSRGACAPHHPHPRQPTRCRTHPIHVHAPMHVVT
jgi:hypothetical protein